MKKGTLGALLLISVACTQSDTVAVVDGEPIARGEFEALHPDTGDLVADERAGSVFLLVLHHLVTSRARTEFGITADAEEMEAAFAERVAGAGDDIDVRLTDRGVTRERVRIEAELDVLRTALQSAFIERGGEGVDLDAAYRQFISLNSIACVTLLAPESNALLPEIEVLVAGGATLEEIAAEVAVEEVDLGCTNPVQHPVPVQPVALDGDVGVAYIREFTDGTVYVAGVTERDAPTLAEVEDEVFAMAADTQGRDLFDAWVVDLLRTADVEVDSSIGTWEPAEGTNGVPTVVAP